MTKRCSKCEIEREATEFSPDRRRRDGLQSQCKPCRAAERAAYRRTHPTKVKEQKARSNAKHRDRSRRRNREYWRDNRETLLLYHDDYRAKNYERRRWRQLFYNHGITREEYELLLNAQAGGCAICTSPPEGRPLNVDHDHETGIIRGLLCDHCNRGLGCFSDDPSLLTSAINYIRASSSRLYGELEAA